jgi:class 3 adenylate cyclase/tetratricopeptide (TPR) repeat protein
MTTTISRDRSEALKPYVPRLLIQWVRESPEECYRAVDGSLAFVDISGFTTLTELLSRKGKIGAELMRDTLDGVFGALLDEAYDWGAGLLKWGGDALLILFDGPDHAQRAARASWEMQRTIDRVGRLRVAGGSVRLRMSIGVTTGKIEFFTAGSVHRELLVAGPAATETVTLEAIADAGEIALSHTLAACLEPACIGAPKEQALLLAAPPDIERKRAPDVGIVREEDVAGCIPVAARAHVLLEKSEPEHRTVTAAFIDLMDTDELLARLGPEAFAAAVDERITAIQEAALRYGVPFYETDIGKGSVKALLTAGAPSSTGHDEEQMLRALREVMDRPGTVSMRVGVNTGKVFTGDFGPPYRRAYRVFGDAINTAARVMGHAEAGQILATETVLERSRTLFETTPIAPFRAKGKAEPVMASVVGVVAGTRAERVAETPLVGRDGELAALLEIAGDVRRGTGWVVEISGVPGSGRSRLVHELVARCPDLTVLRARCEEYEASTPYYALRSPVCTALGLEPGADAGEAERRLRDVVADADPSLAPWIPLLGVLLGLDLAATPETARLDERFLRSMLAEVATRLFDAMLGEEPWMLVVEDAHFLDEASADLLHRLARARRARRQLLVVTHSEPATTWAPPADEELLSAAFALLPLSERHLNDIIALATEQHPLSPHDTEAVARRSNGNVLFLFELLDALTSAGTADSLPESVEAVIAGEIDRLAPADRTVLRYASVLGATFDPALLSAALGDGAELGAAAWERLRGLVDPDPAAGMRFRNTLVRDVAYEGLPFRRRRELHGRVAEAIEASADSSAAGEEMSALALHFYEAERFEEAWHYCRLAGDRARSIAATVEAARFYERALEAARRCRDVPAAERARVWRSLGAVRDASGLFDRAHAALQRATALFAGDDLERAQTYEERSRARIRAGAYGRALREIAIGLRVADALGPPERERTRARLLAQRAELRLLQGHPREAVQLARRALEEGAPVEELEAVARSYSALDGAYQMLGEPDKAVNELKALEIWAQLGKARTVGIIQMNVGVQAYADGRWDEAFDWYRRSEVDCTAAGDRQNAAIATANLGELLVSRGLLDDAEAELRKSRRVLRASGATPYALFAETQLARISLARGLPEEALEALIRIAEEARDVGHAGIALEIAVYFATAATAAGEAERALTALDDAARTAGDEAALLSVPIDRVQGAALIALGRLDEAAARLDRALERARRQSLLYEQFLIMRERAALAPLLGAEPDASELCEAPRLAQLLGIDLPVG